MKISIWPIQSHVQPTLAFVSGITFKYDDLFTSLHFSVVALTSLLAASTIDVDGTNYY